MLTLRCGQVYTGKQELQNIDISIYGGKIIGIAESVGKLGRGVDLRAFRVLPRQSGIIEAGAYADIVAVDVGFRTVFVMQEGEIIENKAGEIRY